MSVEEDRARAVLESIAGVGDGISAETAIQALLAYANTAQGEGVQVDADGEAMVCTGCGTTRTVAAIKAAHPKAFTCCPERKMIPVREALATTPDAQPAGSRLREALAERVFRHGFSEGWWANQNGKLAYPAAVDEAWQFYLKNGVLQKSIDAALSAPDATPKPSPASEEVERLREALRPFADYASFYDSCEQHPDGCPDDAQASEVIDITVGDFRRARAALSDRSGE